MSVAGTDGDALQGHVRSVTEKELGSVFAVAAAAGATSITVDRVTDLPAAGAVQINDQVITYAALNPTTRVVTLDAGLTADAVEGDAVLLYDVELEAVATELKAWVQPDGVGGDTIEAIVDHGLADTLVPGTRDGEGESVLCRRVTGEWWVEKVLGKSLRRDTVGQIRTAESGQRVELVNAESAHSSSASVELYTGYEPIPGVESEPAVLRASYIDSAGVTEDVRLSGPPAGNIVGPNLSLQTRVDEVPGGQSAELYAMGEVILYAEGPDGVITLYAPIRGVELTGPLNVTGATVLEDLADGAPGDAASGARFCRVGDNGRLWASEDLPASVQAAIDALADRISDLEGTVANHTTRLNNHRDELDNHEARISDLESP